MGTETWLRNINFVVDKENQGYNIFLVGFYVLVIEHTPSTVYAPSCASLTKSKIWKNCVLLLDCNKILK